MSDTDCEACPSTSPLQIVIPENIEITLSLTDKARGMLMGAIGDNSDSALLVDVLSGGCSGYKYDLQIIEPVSGDEYIELFLDGIHVFVPKTASSLLDGVEIDYEDKLMGGGFKINNPNASKNCGCGESFR